MKYLSLVFLSGLAFGQTSVSLSWNQSTTPNTTVTVYRASSSCNSPFLPIAKGIAPGGPYVAGNLLPGGTYAFQVTASLAGLESLPSNCVLVTIPTQLPAAPTALSVAIPQ